LATYRQIHVKIWTSPDFQKLSPQARLVFIYLFSNDHRNEAGLYRITKKTISNETDLTIEEVETALQEIESANLIKYDDKDCVVWVINAVNYQKTNPNEVKAINKNLAQLNHPFVEEFRTYYEELLNTSEGLPKDLPKTLEGLGDKGKGKYKGKGKGKGKPPTPKPPKSEKINYAENVALTQDEHQKLVGQYGETATKRMIEILDNYKGANGKRYKSDYKAILNWVVDRYQEEQAKLKPRAPTQVTGTGPGGAYKPVDPKQVREWQKMMSG
jgi:hypothetical protein